MREESERRLARNEILFRETNEAIERGQWPGDPGKVVRFRCECSRRDCNQAIEVSLEQYERVRRFPRRFIVASGHEMPEIETVVGLASGCVIVEKQDAAGQTAAAANPRQ